MEHHQTREALVERSGTYFYLITIKCNHMQYTSRDKISLMYRSFLRKLRTYELSDTSAWELDSANRWHYHFIVCVGRQPYYPKFQINGWTIHFQSFHINDYFNVVNYLKKINQHPAHLDNLDIESQNYNGLIPFMDD